MEKETTTEQEILENIIDTHFKALEFYKQKPEEYRAKILTEHAQIAIYVGKYGLLEKHPKYWEYNGKIAGFMFKK